MFKKLTVFTLLAYSFTSLSQTVPSTSHGNPGPRHNAKPGDRFNCSGTMYLGQNALLASERAKKAMEPAETITNDKLPKEGYPQKANIGKNLYRYHYGRYFIYPIPFPIPIESKPTTKGYSLLDSRFEVADVIYYNENGEWKSCRIIELSNIETNHGPFLDMDVPLTPDDSESDSEWEAMDE